MHVHKLSSSLILLSVVRCLLATGKLQGRLLPDGKLLPGDPAGPDAFEREGQANARECVEARAVHKEKKPVVRVESLEDDVAQGIGDQAENAPDDNERDVIDDFDGGMFGRLNFARQFVACGSGCRSRSDPAIRSQAGV